MNDKAPDDERPDPSEGAAPPPSGPPPSGPPYGPPTSYPQPYGPPPAYQVPPGPGPWPAYGDPSAYPGPAYGQPAAFFAAPDDPLVSADFAGWWRRSFALLSALWPALLQVQLIWAIPYVVLTAATALAVSDAAAADNDYASVLLELPFTVVGGFVAVLAQVAGLSVVVQHATGRPVRTGPALRDGLSRFFPLLGWQILAGFVIVMGVILCLLPGIYAAVVLSILPVIVLLERGEGVGRAFELVHRNFGAAAGRLGTMAGLYLAIGLAEFGAAYALVPLDETGIAVNLVDAVLSAAFSVVVGVVLTPFMLTTYADLRARHERFSTATLTEQS